MLRKPGRWCCSLALFLFSLANAEAKTAESVLPGASLERSITAEERHVYRVEAAGSPLLITVEQRGIDLIVEARGPGDAAPVVVDAPLDAWGTEVLLLSVGAGHHLEVHSGQSFATSGSYTLRVEAVPEDGQRTRALDALSRGGRLAATARPQALAAYREALAVWRTLGEKRWEAEALQAIADLEDQEDNLRAAAEGHLAASSIWRDLDEPRREAVALRRLGVVRKRSGENGEAREAQERALSLWQGLGETVEEERTQSEICLLDHTRGALPEALACYGEVLAFFRQLGDRSQEAQILNNLGGVFDILGEPDTALAHYQQALELRRTLEEPYGQIQTLTNIAVIHRTLGEWQEALSIYGQLHGLIATFGNRDQQARMLNNVGFFYKQLGESQRARVLLQEALEMRREIGDRRGELITLNNLGQTWLHLGDPGRALAAHREALAIAVALEDAGQQTITHMRIAEVAIDQGDAPTALRELAPALDSWKMAGLRRSETEALRLQGQALLLAGRAREALAVFQDTLAARRALRDRLGEAQALHDLARAEQTLRLPDAAYAHTAEAISQIEALRTGFVSPDLRASFMATQRRAYALLIDLLMDRHRADPRHGYDREALRISEQARARSLLDALHSGRSTATSSVPALLIEQRLSLRHRLSAKVERQVKLSQQKKASTEDLSREIETLLTELDGLEAKIRQFDPQRAARLQPPPLEAKEIAAILESDTLLLEYALGEERSYLWVVGTGSCHSFPLPSRREIETLARQVSADLSTVEVGSGRRDAAAQMLAQHLLSPFWKDLTSGIRRLVIVPDGGLHYLPFSALPAPAPGLAWDTPRSYLLEHLEVVVIPSATTLALQRQVLAGRSPALKQAAVLADPVFSADDPRLSSSTKPPGQSRGTGDLLPVFERLPASGREAEAIRSLLPAGQAWTAQGLEASREAVLSGRLRDYRILHFATHGIVDDRSPELSGLVLSLVDGAGQPQEGFLGLADIYELDLRADLVVLSGCRTALGREVGGEGLLGITRAFLHAGVPRVAAGLWKVQDRTTAELMTRFYRALWQDGLPAAAALRKAQLSMRRDYRHPYYWAGFVLQGDWR
jgi:CHAT domain-containing protein/tetratricopeptide (TPR) repeat protein